MRRFVRGLSRRASFVSSRVVSQVSIAAALVAFFGGRDAHAYCRTTTVPLPAASFDPSASGSCWTQGTPLAWPAGSSIGYSLAAAASTQVTLSDATRVADAAFATWNTATCPTSNPSDAASADAPNVQAYDSGPSDAATVAMDCGLVQCSSSVHDTHHIIVFRDTDWTHNDANNTLALTTVTYGVDSGTIYDADIEINSSTTANPPHLLTTEEPPPPNLPPNTYDLQAILTHEAGHFFGLAHATDMGAIMYAYYQPGSLALTGDDLNGICAIYPPGAVSGTHSSSCAIESMPASTGTPATAAGFGFVLLALARKRKAKI